MAQFNNLSLTTKGLALQTKAQTGVQLNFTKVQFGDGSLATGETVANLTALKSVKLTTPIASNTVIGDGTSQIRTILNNSNLATGFYLREVGVFAQDPDEGEILYEYAMAGEYADYIPAGTGNSVFESTLDLIAIIGNASNVTATIQSGAYTSQLDFEERNAESTGYGVISGGEITAQSTPNMSVNVSTINADLPSGKKATQNQNTVSIDASDSTKPRTDIVYVKSDGTIGYLKSGLGTGAVAGKETYTIGTNAVGAIAGSKNYTINTNAVGVVAGSNTYTVDTNFIAGDTVVFDGITFTAVVSGATGNQFNVGTSTTESATNLASALNTNSTINALYNVSASNEVVTIAEKTAGGGHTPGDMATTGTGKITAGTVTESKTADTVTIEGVTFTAVASGATGNEFNIGTDIPTTATNLVSAINANTTINATYTISSSNNTITLTEKVVGGGNTPTDITTTGTITVTNGTATTSKSADTVTINGITFTAVASGATGNQFNVGTDTTATATNLASVLNSNTTINSKFTATSSSNIVTLTEKTAGGGHTPTTSSTTGTVIITNGTVINSTAQIYPSAPTTPDGGMLLSQIAVGAGATNIVQSNITDKRIFKLNNNQLGSQMADMSYDLNNFTGVTDQDKLINAIAFFNGSNGTLLIAKNYSITANITVPKNITLKFTQGGLLTIIHPYILQIDGNIDAGIRHIFSCTAGDVLLINLKQEAYPQWFGAKGDRVTNDQSAINGVVYSQCPVVRIPRGIYQAYLANGFSNRTFICDEGSIIDGVVHLAVGKGPGIAPYPTEVKYVENIRVIGCLTSTVRVGTYYCRNINIDKIHLLATDSQYVNQTTEGGQKGNHFTSGTENLTIGEQIIDGTTNLTYALGIDIYPTDTVNLPKNFKFGKVTIKDCTTSGIQITKIQDLTIDELRIENYDAYSNNIVDCEDVRIGKIYINGLTNVTTNLFGFYANNVTNLTIDEIVSEYNKHTGIYILNCINPTINKITANNNGNKGVYIYNCINAYAGIIFSHDNGAEGVHFESPVTGKLIMSYNNTSANGVYFDTVANGCHDCKFEKIVAYNNKDSNVTIAGEGQNIGEIQSYNPTGAGYALWLINSVLTKIPYIEVYGATQGLRYEGNTNSFLDFIYAHDNTQGIALGASNAGLYNRYVKYGNNATDVANGPLAGITGYNGTVITT